MNNLIQILKGGPGSGDFGHVGRAGKRGGSGGGGGKGHPRKGGRSRAVLDKETERNKKRKEEAKKSLSKGDQVKISSSAFGGEFDGKSGTYKGVGVDPFFHEVNIPNKGTQLFTKEELTRIGGSQKDIKIIYKKTKRKDDDKPLTVYHATYTDVVDSILEKGLLTTPAAPKSGIPEGVYHTKRKSTAETYGEATGTDSYAIIEFEIPRNEKGKVHIDQYDRQKYEVQDAFYYEDKISPEWIKRVYVYEWDDRKGFMQIDTIEKQDNTGISFSVVGIDEPTEDKKTKLKHVYDILKTF